jgi:hypothetical protein
MAMFRNTRDICPCELHMPLTFGLTGMDPATESSLKAAFVEANTLAGNRWKLLPETEADFVVVDMDSMYGPMSWLRLHAAGKRVIGLTSVARTQTDFRLERPFTTASVGALLQQLDSGAPAAAAVEAAPVPPAPTPAPATPPAAPAPPAPSPAGMTPAPQPQDQLPEELPPVLNPEVAAPAEPAAAAPPADAIAAVATREPPSAAAGRIVPPAPTFQPHVPAATAEPAPTPAPPPPPAEPHTLAEWLASNRLGGHLRFDRNGTPLLIDAVLRQYYGPATLKAIAGHFSGDVALADFEALDEATWAKERAALGEAQPLSRLVWFGGLLAGKGTLAPGFDPESRYQLLKWPQTEREFPKHFRIATAMMKGPATLHEIAEASGVPLADVTDFVNASIGTGFAGPYREPEPEVEPPKPSGLFGRLRGR